MRVLVTGATGNAGREVISALRALNREDIDIFAGLTSPDKAADQFGPLGVGVTWFDFDKAASMRPALAGCDVLARPAGLLISHLLGEIEKLVTHVGILHRGRLQFQGTIDGGPPKASAREMLEGGHARPLPKWLNAPGCWHAL